MNSEAPLSDLLNKLLQQLTTLFRTEIRLARAETIESASKLMGAVAFVGAGAILFIAALMMLLMAAAGGLMALNISAAWSYLIVGILSAIAGYLILRYGINGFTSSALISGRTVNRTIGNLERDAVALKEDAL